jgi:hypothetical protein
MLIWIGIHHHRHGIDLFPVAQQAEPTHKTIIDLIEAEGSSFEHSDDENIEIRGPWEFMEDTK